MAGVGVFGKLPQRADFIAHRLPASFSDPWHAWLSAGLAESRTRLGSRFVEVFLQAPVWRFVLQPGRCGPAAAAGILMPSVDAAERLFFLSLATTPEGDVEVPALLQADRWFDGLEEHARLALESGFVLEAWLAATERLSLPPASQQTAPHGWTLLPDGRARDGHARRPLPKGRAARLHVLEPRLALRPAIVLSRRLAAGGCGLRPAARRSAGRRRRGDNAMTAALTIVDAGLTHIGKVRKANEDAWMARPDLGIWAVADGMGGHQRGDVASRTIVDHLARIHAPADARSLRRDVDEALARADAELKAAAEATGEISASTVVALLVFGAHFAVLWAGDSRAYRLRNGALERLTRDHSLVQELVDSGALSAEDAAIHPLRNQLTRGIGTSAELQVEGRQGEIRAGDSFLLCSDGLTGHLSDDDIAAVIAASSPDQACRKLVERTLAAGASDNVSVVMVSIGDADAERTHPGTG